MTQSCCEFVSDTQCPECGGQLVEDVDDVYCRECHLVVKQDPIDQGPEWRSFPGDGDTASGRRTGDGRTLRYHDKGLSTKMGDSGDWVSLSGRKRERLSRQQTLNKYSKLDRGGDQSLGYALGQIQRIASAVDLDESVTEQASSVFRDVQNEGLTHGRSIDALVAACVYIASRRAQTLRTAADIAEVSHCSERKLQRFRFTIQRTLDVPVPLITAPDHLPVIFDALPHTFSGEERQTAQQITINAAKSPHIHGSPSGIAAAAVWNTLGRRGTCTQQDIAEVADVSPNTLRKRYRALVEASDVPVEGAS